MRVSESWSRRRLPSEGSRAFFHLPLAIIEGGIMPMQHAAPDWSETSVGTLLRRCKRVTWVSEWIVRVHRCVGAVCK